MVDVVQTIQLDEIAPRLGLIPRFAIELSTGMNLQAEDHVEELEK